MKNNKFILFLLVIIFIASANIAFAAEDIESEIVSENDNEELAINEEPVLTADDSQNTLEQTTDKNNVIAAEDTPVVLSSDVKSIKMEGITNRLNGAIWYKATFYDSYGNPLKGKNVVFTLDDDYVNGWEKVTDSNGAVLLKAQISNGNHRLNAFNLDCEEMATDNIKVFDVVSGGKNINMYYDDGTTYTVRVYDNDGNPVKSGEKVTFYIKNKKYVRTTDKNGYAKLKIPSTPGVYVIHAVYKDFYTSHNLKVKNVLKAKTGKVKGKSKIKFTVKYLGKNKKNKLIKVKFNKKTYKAKTNKKGVAIFKLKNPKKSGKYNVVVSYKKAKEYYTYTKY